VELPAVLPLLNTAGIGVLAYLLLTRVEHRLSAVERATNRLLRVFALALVNDRRQDENVRREAKQLLNEVRRENGDKDNGRSS
jgi:hypothetical protein